MTTLEKRYKVAAKAISGYQTFLSTLRYGRSNSPAGDKDHYGFIPRQPEPALESIIAAMELLEGKQPQYKQRAAYKFLDAGCGAGNIMLLANCVGFDSWGIERDPKTIRLARKLHYGNCKKGKGIISVDMIKYKKYGEYDVIYYYQPMTGPKMQLFIEALRKQMKVGAVVLPHGSSQQFDTDKRFKRHMVYHSYMYVKIKEN